MRSDRVDDSNEVSPNERTRLASKGGKEGIVAKAVCVWDTVESM